MKDLSNSIKNKVKNKSAKILEEQLEPDWNDRTSLEFPKSLTIRLAFIALSVEESQRERLTRNLHSR